MSGRVPSGRSKYKNQRVELDGFKFDSKAEARRYKELVLLQRSGVISDLVAEKTKLKYRFIHNGHRIGSYIADFRYRVVKTGEEVVEDVKGVRTPVYRLKKKMMKAFHGIEIYETEASKPRVSKVRSRAPMRNRKEARK